MTNARRMNVIYCLVFNDQQFILMPVTVMHIAQFVVQEKFETTTNDSIKVKIFCLLIFFFLFYENRTDK